MLDLNPSWGRDGLRASRRLNERGGSSSEGEDATLGEMEKLDPVSEIKEGAPSSDSALDASDTEGDGREPWILRDEKVSICREVR